MNKYNVMVQSDNLYTVVIAQYNEEVGHVETMFNFNSLIVYEWVI